MNEQFDNERIREKYRTTVEKMVRKERQNSLFFVMNEKKKKTKSLKKKKIIEKKLLQERIAVRKEGRKELFIIKSSNLMSI